MTVHSKSHIKTTNEMIYVNPADYEIVEEVPDNPAENRVKCLKCSAVLKRRGFSTHIKNIHITTKNFECEVCKAKFKSVAYLKSHSSSHISEKNFQCKSCQAAFKTSKQLWSHTKTVHNSVQVQCKMCSVVLKSQNSLKSHEKSVHGTKNNLAVENFLSFMKSLK